MGSSPSSLLVASCLVVGSLASCKDGPEADLSLLSPILVPTSPGYDGGDDLSPVSAISEPRRRAVLRANLKAYVLRRKLEAYGMTSLGIGELQRQVSNVKNSVPAMTCCMAADAKKAGKPYGSLSKAELSAVNKQLQQIQVSVMNQTLGSCQSHEFADSKSYFWGAGTFGSDFEKEFNSSQLSDIPLAESYDIEVVIETLRNHEGGLLDVNWSELLDVLIDESVPHDRSVPERIRSNAAKPVEEIMGLLVPNFFTSAFDDIFKGANIKASGAHEREWMNDFWKGYKMKERCHEFYGTKWGVPEGIIHKEFMKCMANRDLIKALQGKALGQHGALGPLLQIAKHSMSFQDYVTNALAQWDIQHPENSGLTDDQVRQWAQATFGLTNRDIRAIMKKDDQMDQDGRLSAIDKDVTVIVVTHNNTLLDKFLHLFGVPNTTLETRKVD